LPLDSIRLWFFAIIEPSPATPLDDLRSESGASLTTLLTPMPRAERHAEIVIEHEQGRRRRACTTRPGGARRG